jgi:hypothetical protein
MDQLIGYFGLSVGKMKATSWRLVVLVPGPVGAYVVVVLEFFFGGKGGR